jgi:ribosome biogenesis protein BMS1
VFIELDKGMDLLGKAKKHRPSKSGAKAKKKDDNSKKKRGLSTDRHNPRAFSVANIGRTKRTQQRNLDRAQKKEVVPLVNRTEELPPPIVVVVAGPRGVGKSSLIRSLVKLYTGQNIVDIKGPVTVVAGKKTRFTFFECPLDIYSMTDLAKIADLVFLMIDASYGFEMDTFEFLNLLQLHGFPKVVGILTHLDQFKVNKSLQKTKKILKHRFWTEIYKGAKIFEFTGVVNGKYLKHEVKRMSLYITRLKFRPLIWRNTHPYLLVDRVDDITPTSTIQENPTCDREISFHGYVRGTHLKSSLRLHLIGAGDFDIASVTALEDPCPMPSQNDRTTLKNSKDNFLYAPMSNVGRVKIDKDGMYIEIKDIHYTKPEMLDLVDQNAPESYRSMYDDITRGSGVHTPAGILRSMQDVDIGVDERLNNAELSLFQGENAIKSSQTHFALDADGYSDDDESGDDENEENDEEEEGDEDEEEDDDQEDEDEEEGDDDVSVDDEDDQMEEQDDDLDGSDVEEEEEGDEDEDENWSDEDSDSEDELPIPSKHKKAETETETSNVKWKENLGQRAEKSFANRATVHGISTMERVYGKGWAHNGGLKDDFVETKAASDDESGSDSDEDFFQPKRNALKSQYDFANRLDSSKPSYTHSNLLLDKDLERSKLWEAFSTGKATLKSSQQSDENAADVVAKYTSLKNRFVTGNWGKSEKDDLNGGLSDDEGFGEFEDLQTGEVFGSNGVRNSESDGSDDDEGVVDMDKFNQDIDEQLREANAARKAASRLTNGEDENSDHERNEKVPPSLDLPPAPAPAAPLVLLLT